MKRIIIIGATSGLGFEMARQCIHKGWHVGVAGRRMEELDKLKGMAPEQVETERIDVTSDEAPLLLQRLIDRLGGMDVYLHSSGIGSSNVELESDSELRIQRTNGEGFVRMVTTAYAWFRVHGGGHIAAITSIAGTKGIGASPAYSATKRMQSTYLEALAQRAHTEKLGIVITDIMPGFVDTPILTGNYPMVMRTDYAVHRILKAIELRKRRTVIDWRYAALVRCWRMIPGWLWERIPIRKHAEITLQTPQST